MTTQYLWKPPGQNIISVEKYLARMTRDQIASPLDWGAS